MKESSSNAAERLPEEQTTGHRSIFLNGFALAVGRNINSLLRLVLAAVVARGFGSDAFAAYSFLLATMLIAEWMADFGTTDVFVRDVGAHPESYREKLRALATLKIVQAPVAFLAMLAFVLVFSESRALLEAAAVLGLGVFAFTLSCVYRALFKLQMTLAKEVISEFVSVLSIFPLIALAWRNDLGLVGIAGSIATSRVVFLFCCRQFARDVELFPSQPSARDAAALARESVLIGTIGLLSVINNSAEVLVLSSLSSEADVARFSAAQKTVWPIFMVLGAIGTVFFPVFARLYGRDRDQFHRVVTHAVSAVAFIGLCGASGMIAGADFLMGLISPEFRDAVDALYILLAMCLLKSVAAALGPLLYVVHAERAAFGYFAFSVCLKLALLFLVAPAFGYTGVALLSLGVEAFLVIPCTLYFLRSKAGVKIQLRPTLLLCLTCTATVIIVDHVLDQPAYVDLILAPLIFALIALGTGQFRLRATLDLLRKK